MDILAHRFHIVSVDNSYILVDQEVEITIPKSDDGFVKYYYIGYLIPLLALVHMRLILILIN